MKFAFTDRASYLAWRAQWKAEYKALSESIRDSRRRNKQFIRRYERSMGAAGPTRTLISKEENPLYGLPGLPWLGGSLTATFMLEQLKEAKALSWQMRLAAKSAA